MYIKTIQEKQDLINTKDWDTLITTDLFLDFNYGTSAFKQYTFDRDFVLSFVFNVDRFIAHTKHVAALTATNLYSEDVLQNVLFRCADLGVNLSTDDWKKIISATDTLRAKEVINSTALANVLNITGKDVNYLRLLLDDKMVAKLSSYDLTSASYFKLNAIEFAKLSPEEQHKIAPLLTYNNNAIRVYIDNGDERIFANVTKDYREINIISQRLILRVSSILADLGPDEYTKALLEMIDSGDDVTVVSWLPYFLEHPDYEIDDEQFKKLFDKFGAHAFMYITNNVSEKVIVDNIKSIHIGYLVKRQSMSLERLTELVGKKNTDLTGHSRFFTEEEIAANPHFFDPRVLNRIVCAYVSHDTFKLLNKTWGLRQKYNDELRYFEAIVSGLPPDAISPKTLRYLKEKTKASNEVVINAIKRKHLDDAWGKYAKKLVIVKKFITKFDQ